MKPFLSASFASLLARRDTNTIDYNAAPPNLSTLANSSLFETWRPRAHVLPPSNHVGDPCMHYTDPKTGLFHVGYLYSSNSTSGAAGATTADFVTYEDVKPDVPLFIEPGGKNDPLYVFDGSIIPKGINNTPTLLYTSVSYIPIHWTVPYIKGSETQSLAVSYDGGMNFTKVEEGPVIPGAPFGSVALNVTGFRDPYVLQSSQLDEALGSTPGVWYAVISGGVHGQGPRQFLYRQYDIDFRDWEYLGEWWQEPANSTWGDGVWAARFGFNFECGNLFALNEMGYDEEGEVFTTFGAEWGYAPVPLEMSPERSMLWASGNISNGNDGDVKFDPYMAGTLDWGLGYAAASKLVPGSSKAAQKAGVGDRQIIYLWLTNNRFGNISFPINQQGWDGTLTTPRELFRSVIPSVANNGLVSEVASWRIIETNENGTVSLATLGQTIVREASSAFISQATNHISQGPLAANPGSTNITAFSQSPSSRFFMMTATIQFPSTARGNTSDVKAGFRILGSEYESTLIYYQFSNESIILDVSNSSAAALSTNGVQNVNLAGKLRLFDVQNSAGSTGIETLNLTILLDNGVLEIYANDRFAMSTWVWPWYASSNSVAYFFEGPSAVQFGAVDIYEGLVDAWPGRS